LWQAFFATKIERSEKLMSEGRFAKYFFSVKIASGGMGEVLLARQQGPEGFEKILVIKRILSHHTDNQDYVDMFSPRRVSPRNVSLQHRADLRDGEIDGPTTSPWSS